MWRELIGYPAAQKTYYHAQTDDEGDDDGDNDDDDGSAKKVNILEHFNFKCLIHFSVWAKSENKRNILEINMQLCISQGISKCVKQLINNKEN